MATGHLVRYGWSTTALLIIACIQCAPFQRRASDARDENESPIEQVVSGGRWQTSATMAGNFRVLVRREGGEDIRRLAVLQWVEDRDNGIVVGRSTELNALAHVYALSDPTIIRRGANWMLRLRAAVAPLSQYDSVVEFVLGDPGTVTLVRSPAPAI
jgi:hypothetical protein